MTLTNDNSNLVTWPEVMIVAAEEVSKSIRDREPFQMKLTLSCGHWCYYTFGDQFVARVAGDKMRCRACFLEKS